MSLWRGIREVIRERILVKGESLYEEPLHLLREEADIRTPGSYFDVIRAIAAGATRVNEIAQQTASSTPLLAPRLARLVSLGYLEIQEPLEPTGFVPKRGYYRIRDPFFRFWFRYVFPNRSRLERGRVEEVARIVEGDLDTYMGLAFEQVCRDWVGTYAARMPAATEIGGWWNRSGTAEIDLVATAKGRYTMVGTCRWSADASPQVLGALKRDAEILGPKAAGAKLLVFTRGAGVDLRRRAAREKVRLVEAADLFA
ncbi:MAG: DUF234 domain-containing protein [Actinomycetota bacterium]